MRAAVIESAPRGNIQERLRLLRGQPVHSKRLSKESKMGKQFGKHAFWSLGAIVGLGTLVAAVGAGCATTPDVETVSAELQAAVDGIDDSVEELASLDAAAAACFATFEQCKSEASAELGDDVCRKGLKECLPSAGECAPKKRGKGHGHGKHGGKHGERGDGKDCDKNGGADGDHEDHDRDSPDAPPPVLAPSATATDLPAPVPAPVPAPAPTGSGVLHLSSVDVPPSPSATDLPVPPPSASSDPGAPPKYADGDGKSHDGKDGKKKGKRRCKSSDHAEPEVAKCKEKACDQGGGGKDAHKSCVEGAIKGSKGKHCAVVAKQCGDSGADKGTETCARAQATCAAK
jgi:hypothetical protein